MNTNIHVNVNEIPPEVAERIGCVFLGFHKRFQQSPELMAKLEAYRAASHPSHKGSENEALQAAQEIITSDAKRPANSIVFPFRQTKGRL